MQVDKTRQRSYLPPLLRFALRRALRRRAPDSIPLGPSGLDDRNYATTYIDGISDSKYWLVDGICRDDTVQLREIVGTNSPVIGSCPLRDLKRASFRVRVYYKQLEWQFFSLYRYAFFSIFGMARLRAALDKLHQKLANRASLPTIERTRALQIAVQRVATTDMKTISVLQTLALQHRQYRHPNIDNAIRFHRFVLDSLVESGELKRNDAGQYEVLPKALVTLDRYLMEERRIKSQGRAALWTALLAAVTGGIVSGIVSLKEGNVQPPPAPKPSSAATAPAALSDSLR